MDIALALGGGGYKGIAHIGVLDRLESHGFQVKAIAGTSAGGLVGAAYAAGNSPLQILRAVKNLDPNRIYRRHTDDGPSLVGHAGLIEMLSHLVQEKTFSDLKIPFACTAVDLNASCEVYLREGKVIEAAAATMAIPAILPPIRIGSALLVDGGVLDPVPVALARLLAPHLPIVAVALTPGAEEWSNIPPGDILASAPLPLPLPVPLLQNFARMRFGQALRIFSHSLELSSMMITELRLKIDKPDIIIRPQVEGYGIFDITEPLELMEIGRRAVDEQLFALRKEVSWRGHVNRLFRRIKPVDEPRVLNQLGANNNHVEPEPAPEPQIGPTAQNPSSETK
jgi:NTE family protein